MVGIVDEFLEQHPQPGAEVAYEPFYSRAFF
jgi:hypothetical protein